MCSTPFRRNALNLLIKSTRASIPAARTMSSLSRTSKFAASALAAVGVGVSGTMLALHRSVYATELELHPAHYPWYHAGKTRSFDHESLRRGYQVYRQVCAACHSMQFLAFRHLINVTHTQEEAKALAQEFDIEDGPNDTGKMFRRPGKLSDYFPNPYKNEEEAKAANNGVVPPDLSLIVPGREGNEDYVFSILTGYEDPPAGVTVGEGQFYNPYFPGQVISMAEALYNEIIEYEDGTPATQSQLAKDVVCFLRWAAEPYMERKKEMAFTMGLWFMVMIPCSFYLARRTWMSMKTMDMQYRPIKNLKPNLKRKVQKSIKD